MSKMQLSEAVLKAVQDWQTGRVPFDAADRGIVLHLLNWLEDVIDALDGAAAKPPVVAEPWLVGELLATRLERWIREQRNWRANHQADNMAAQLEADDMASRGLYPVR